jgi:hypothetical protein
MVVLMTLSARVCVVVTSSKQTELDVLCGLFCNAKVGAGLCPRTQKKKKNCAPNVATRFGECLLRRQCERAQRAGGNELWGMFNLLPFQSSMDHHAPQT